MSNQEPIAVIGSGCRFAGSLNSPSKLWEFLQAPYDLLRKVPSNRWDSKAFYHKDPEHHGTTNVQESYFLDEDITAFDNSFFSIQPGEAEAIDPQQRMLMETVYDSLCAAGQTIEGLRGSQTAVYVGVMCDDWSAMLASDRESTPQYAATGMARSIMSNRISYFFDWHGPSMTIDTACSSSMVAVHQAVQTIRSGESQLAVVAGSNLILHPGMYIAQSKLHMNSPSARCRMWDVDADGYGRGEGIAAVVLKPLSAAIKDGDSVECIIRAISVNQNGRTPGLTMPSAKAQAALIRDTYTRAGLDVSKQEHRPQFFQAHGTGTPAGDSQEAEGISRAFSFADKPSEKLFVGSVKTVIGHTEGAAGLASLISTSLALQHGLIPPNMHFNALNPRLLPFYTHLHVPSSATTWPVLPPGQPRRASINSFGFGGTNVHAILEAYQSAPSQDLNYPLFTPLTVSAASERSLRALLSSYSAYLKANPQISLRDFAYTLQMRRSTLSNRTVIAASSSEEAFEKMDAILRDERNVDLGTKHFGISKPKILGIFTGQGAQWPRMGARLIETSPFVAKRLAELDRMLTELPSADRPTWTLQEQLLADEAGSRVAEAAVSQPLCTAVQILLVDLLRAAGVTLHAVVGHSSGTSHHSRHDPLSNRDCYIGEIGAAYAAGLLPAESAIRVAYYRGLYAELARSPNGTRGAMLAVGSTFEEMSSFCDLEAFRGRLQIAARNSLTSITLAGDEDAIAEAAEMLTNEGKFARQLKVDTAYHSVHMLPCAVPYLESMDKSKVCATNGNGATWYSSVDQGHVMSTNGLKAQYWVDNMTNPVLFAPAVTAAVTQDGPFDLAIEVGPHPALKTPCLDTLQEVTGDRIPYSGMLSRGQDDVKAVSNALGFLWSHLGVGSVAFETFAQKISGASATGRPIPKLPSYPFDHSRSYWSLSRLTAAHKRATDPPHPILGRRCNERETSNEVEWRNILRVKEVGWLKGHRLQGQIVFPATGYIALAVEAIGTLVGWSNVGFITIENLVIGKAIAFNDDDSSIETVFKLKHSTGGSGERHAEFSFYSGDLYSERSPLMLSATGTITASLSEARADAIASTTPEHSTTIDIETGRFYKSLSKLGYQYSEPFYGIKSIRRKNGFATGMVQDQSGTEWEDQLLVHPGLIDSALQTCFAAFSCPGDERLWGLHVPTRFQSVTINPFFVSTCFPKRGDFLYNAIAGESKKGKLGAGLDLLSRDGAHIFMQIEGIEMVPFSAPLPENDAIFFSGFEYKLDRPNGEMAATGDGATTQEFQLAIDQERISFYYLRQLVDTLTSQERATTLPHYKHLLAWAVHAVNLVNSDKNPFIPSDCQHDTYEQIQSMLDR
ncbi:MAG: Type I Iterative PKS [Bathelium mastoideum]|nr:MAG: Type I Iterative PKS [Bathelium mastoideum]